MKNIDSRTTCHLCAGCDPNCPCCKNSKEKLDLRHNQDLTKQQGKKEEEDSKKQSLT